MLADLPDPESPRIYAGGKQWKGLMNRREIEREICMWGQQ